MSGQALDLRRSVHIVRRHKLLVCAAAALGLLAGCGYTALKPPMFTSQALVVLPASEHDIATQQLIAGSDPVLAGAERRAGTRLPLETMRSRIQVRRLTFNVFSVSAQGGTRATAAETANAVAGSYVAYVGSASSPVGRVQARVLQRATTTTGAQLLTRLIEDGALGLLIGALIGAVIALAAGRNDRRLRERDEIADSIGVPVLASLPVGHPSDAAGWAKLLEDYEPGAVNAWRLRKALRLLRPADDVNLTELRAHAGFSIAVLSLSSDQNALALGPQLAAFTASLGISTALVVGPQQDTNAAATLRAACGAPAPAKRPGNLQVTVSDHDHASTLPGAALTIVVAVVDGKTPRVGDTMRAAVTVLGVSAGTSTAEQLARVAASAAADGRELAGILVADPDAADQTTGRAPRFTRPGQRRMPARMTGMAGETRQ